ncbi:MFS transporter [Solwaraspora sp. WMMB335]|uniref:MFS transporter n=1 Tax=Solwaraspora sp. WMMB335 TaxID=3404118 RepID=UPI003B95C6E1
MNWPSPRVALARRRRTARARPGAEPGPFAPLSIPVFRALWLAEFAGDMGNWMHTVGAQWVIVGHANAVLLAALVVAAARMPVLVLSVPIGAIADFVDRRWLLLAAQSFQTLVGVALAVTSLLGRLSPTALLVYTLLLGLGSALSMVAFQALVPQLVAPPLLHSAVALAQVNLNIARVLGPVLGGLLVALAGPSAVFVLDALSYLVFVIVLCFYKIPGRPARSRPAVRRALVEGMDFVRRSMLVRRIMVHSLLIGIPSSAVWALLPSVSTLRLGVDATGYGLLLAAAGTGSIFGALLLPRMRRRASDSTGLVLGSVASVGALGALGLVKDVIGAAIALYVFGIAWMVMQTPLAATMALTTPDPIRGRVLALFQTVRMGSQSAGAVAWGLAATDLGLVTALVFAAVIMALAALVALCLPVGPRRRTAGWPPVASD